MLKLLKTAIGPVFLAGVLAAAQGTTARPGTVNYVEGQVRIDGQPVGAKAMGSTEVAPGQVLETDQGKAEMLLTPGVMLRLGDNSRVRVVSPSLTNTEVELMNGEAMVEASRLEKENHLSVLDNGVKTELEKNGLYKFNADQPLLAVYDGKARVLENDREVEVGKGKELALGGQLKPENFDRKQQDGLYQWSRLRSEYEAEANQSSVQSIVVTHPGWWYGTGWYWNPWYSTWAFVPADGLLYSPFGFGFYSPAYWYHYTPPRYFVRPGRVVRAPVPLRTPVSPRLSFGGGRAHRR